MDKGPHVPSHYFFFDQSTFTLLKMVETSITKFESVLSKI